MTRLLLGASALALLSSPALAHDPDFSAERLSTHVRTLSDDWFEGRAPGTPGEDKTVAYLTGAFATAGLEPGGDLRADGTRKWTQDVVLARSTMVDEPLLAMTIGGERVELAQNEDLAVRAPINGDAHVELQDIELVFVGYGTHAPERGWSDYKDQDLAGKVLVMLVNDPDFEGGEGDFGGKEMTYYGRWTYKYEEAARRGAAGVLVIHDEAPASYPWGVVANGNDQTFDIVREDPKAAHSGLQGWMHLDLAERLFAAAGSSYAAAKAAAQRKDFAPMPMGATIDATLLARQERIAAKNVVGILPGRERPDEYVIYTAHHDHLGLVEDPAEHGDAVYNGALDNATGTAALIEQARAFADKGGAERSLVFLAVGAEEKGLLGSKYYAANPLYPLEKTVGVINTDSLGVFGPASDFSISGTARLGLLDLLIEKGSALGRSFAPDPRPEAGGFFRSDHFAFAQVGVPAVSFRSGQQLTEGGAERASELAREYVANHYHQASDEWSPDWRFDGIVADLTLLHRVGEALAGGAMWPNWAEGSEFKALRDASADQRD
ncbi:M28 family peptidase [Sphingomicrobium astaxanthinifaciens]|uniref:M28 family peptidase n=1 Tax=Sphingomicrobium astaxanthinifaciens TaxID=1227949 RepID=UPI001FCA9D00|nr:M28 family peptidase [Sphingomicrobium astaxanthinifaciens]MCJ7420610.1 M28 family peptidase [Sphingomicrobium astaxanthinifaciens]